MVYTAEGITMYLHFFPYFCDHYNEDIYFIESTCIPLIYPGTSYLTFFRYLSTVQRDSRGRSVSTSSVPNLGGLSNTWSGADQQAASITPGMGAVIRTKLQLVDLAGSECVGEDVLYISFHSL
jgi:hypothetical protein